MNRSEEAIQEIRDDYQGRLAATLLAIDKQKQKMEALEADRNRLEQLLNNIDQRLAPIAQRYGDYEQLSLFPPGTSVTLNGKDVRHAG